MTVGGVSAAPVTVVSATRITVKVPNATVTGKITVTTSGGTVTSAATFSVDPGVLPTPVTGPPGTVVTVPFGGFGAFEAVDLYLDTTDVTLASASRAGGGTASVTVPTSATPGTHWITAVGGTSCYSAQSSFLVRTNWSQTATAPATPA